MLLKIKIKQNSANFNVTHYFEIISNHILEHMAKLHIIITIAMVTIIHFLSDRQLFCYR